MDTPQDLPAAAPPADPLPAAADQRAGGGQAGNGVPAPPTDASAAPPRGPAIDRPRELVVPAFTAFAAFGAFWGVWGASVPRVQAHAGVDDGQLGIALLFVGAGALPSTLLVGRALDRWGLRIAALLIAALGVLGAGVAAAAAGFVSLCAGLALLGACSGAADVCMNAVAGRAEQFAGRPVIARAHGTFSTFVVLAGLATGLATAAGAPLAAPFAVVAAVSAAAGVFMAARLPPHVAAAPRNRPAEAARAAGPGRRAGTVAPLLLVGVLGALAFASENAHQSWSAVFAHRELHAGTGLAAVAPAVFAGTVALTRFGAGGLSSVGARALLRAGALGAAGGATIVALAPTLTVAAVGLVVAGAGTGVLFPTVVGIVSRNVDEARRGRATSLVTGVSYLGFLLGPVYVGLWADATGLRGAMGSVAALGAALLLLTPLVLRLSGFRVDPLRTVDAGPASAAHPRPAPTRTRS
jgi:MFS family permease